MNPSITFAALGLLIVFWAVGAYRRLSRQRKQCKTAFTQVDAQVKRRHELMLTLVETASGNMTGEHDVLELVITADNEAVAASVHAGRNALDTAAMARITEAEFALDSALGGMFAVAQRHTGPASDQTMRQLTEELIDVESKIVFARQVYNEAATQYNAARAQFPGSVIAFVFAFTPVALLPHADARFFPEHIKN